MASFSVDRFVADARVAASSDAAARKTLELMKQTLAEPARVAATMPTYDRDDVVLYEDDRVSIWFVRFHPGIEIPPHDHQMNACIGVYEGVEENSLHRATNGRLERVETKVIGPGEILSLGPSGIHSVSARGDSPSHAIHVYLGRLTTVKRSLFDWDTGEPIPFTDENYQRLLRKPS